MGVRIHQTNLPAHVGGLFGPLEDLGHSIMEGGRAVHEPHSVRIMKIVFDDSLMVRLLVRCEQAGDDGASHGNQPVPYACPVIRGVYDRAGLAINEVDVSGQDSLEDKVIGEVGLNSAGLTGKAGGQFGPAGSLQERLQSAASLVEEGNGPCGGHLSLHGLLGRLKGVVPVPLAIAEEVGVRDSMRLDIVQRPSQVVGYRGQARGGASGIISPKSHRLIQDVQPTVCFDVLSQRQQGPDWDVPVGIVLVEVRILVEHKPLRQGTVGVLVGEDLEEDGPGQVGMAEGQGQFQGPLADIPCTPGGAPVLFQPVGRQKMNQGVLHQPGQKIIEFGKSSLPCHMQTLHEGGHSQVMGMEELPFGAGGGCIRRAFLACAAIHGSGDGDGQGTAPVRQECGHGRIGGMGPCAWIEKEAIIPGPCVGR